LDKIQLEAARLVTGATKRCSTANLYKEVAWETLSSRRQFHRALMLFKIENGQAPSYLQDLVPAPIEARTRYNLRNRADLQVPFARLATYSQSFFPAAARLWNSLPIHLREANTAFSFKSRYLKEYPRPKPNKLAFHGIRKIAVHHARMRIGCSLLNYDLHHNLHVIDDPKCRCIMSVPETAEHFLTICPWYTHQRIIMYAELFMIPNLPPIAVRLLLYGDESLDDHTNIKIFNLVQQFINQSHRFDF
jgi:hypothetical protein